MTIRVCLAGATGWAGAALARGIVQTQDLELVSGVSRQYASKTVGQALGISNQNAPLFASAQEALAVPCDVLVEYTKPDIAKENIRVALQHGAHVVIGTSGLTDQDFTEIDALAQAQQRGVLAVGNFSLAVFVMNKCAEIAARYFPEYEIIDYAHADKKDSPSGTTRELAQRLAHIRAPRVEVPIDETQGPKEARGTAQHGIQVHSVRLPGYVISSEVIFGMLGDRLSIRYDGGPSAAAYVDGALLSIRRVGSFVGLKRGLDSVM